MALSWWQRHKRCLGIIIIIIHLATFEGNIADGWRSIVCWLLPLLIESSVICYLVAITDAKDQTLTSEVWCVLISYGNGGKYWVLYWSWYSLLDDIRCRCSFHSVLVTVHVLLVCRDCSRFLLIVSLQTECMYLHIRSLCRRWVYFVADILW